MQATAGCGRQVLPSRSAVSAHTVLCPIATFRGTHAALLGRAHGHLSCQSSRKSPKVVRKFEQQPHNHHSRSDAGWLLRPCASSTPAADSGSGDGGSGSQGPPKDLKKAGEEEPEDNDLELLSLSQAEELAGAKGIQLPADFIEAAQNGGLRKGALLKYFGLQASIFAGFFAKRFPAFRDRLISDHRFLFKVVAEVLIDSGCATVAEVRKRGEEFWTEFEFYLSDMVVGIVMDVLLVTLMAPVAVIGAKSKKSGGSTRWRRALNRVPSAVFEPSVLGVRQYTIIDRTACLGVKFLEYSLAGLVAGFVGQGVANSLMLARRRIYGAKEDDLAIPPLVMTSLTWGLFMGVSSNIRYQIVFGLERAVDVTIAKAVPPVAYGTSLAIRFANNVIGGENFIDMARWTGIQ
ncbi:hypothetical protein WJX74_010617 [Apatococcus lobatus]|uniref:Protein RETICULATA-RELATED 1, chloroplastic n=1 Tax=Apatococcus lobatus TaxID=904363 RepID=A0AAW1RGN4_9CHLO